MKRRIVEKRIVLFENEKEGCIVLNEKEGGVISE